MLFLDDLAGVTPSDLLARRSLSRGISSGRSATRETKSAPGRSAVESPASALMNQTPNAMQSLPRSRSCFCCGKDNPLGFGFELQSDGRVVEARLKFRREHVGFRQVVHGGLIATVLDEIMAWACGVGANTFAFCAEMSVRYRE